MAAVTCPFPHDSHAHPARHVVDLGHFGAISNIVHLLEADVYVIHSRPLNYIHL